jgi:hypothetical protein
VIEKIVRHPEHLRRGSARAAFVYVAATATLIAIHVAAAASPPASPAAYRTIVNASCAVLSSDFADRNASMARGVRTRNSQVIVTALGGLIADVEVMDAAILKVPLSTSLRASFDAALAPVVRQAAELRTWFGLPGDLGLDSSRSQAVLSKIVSLAQTAVRPLDRVGLSKCSSDAAIFKNSVAPLVLG